MKLSNCFLLTLIFCFCFTINVDAQKKRRKDKPEKSDTSKIEIIKVNLKNGNTLVGKLLKLGQDSIIITNEQFGRMGFAKTEIKNYNGLDKSEKPGGDGWKKEKYQSQYFLSPTARPVGAGNKYYTNFNIFANTFSFGISDNFSITAGFETVSIIAGRFPIVYVNPKLSIPASDNVYFGFGTSLFLVTFDDEINLGGLAYANTTIGSATQNISAGLGLAYAVDGSSEAPMIYQFGFTFPLGKKVSVLAESFVDSSFDGLLNFGIRIITEGNIVFDVGLSRPTGTGDLGIVGIPLLSLSVPF